MGNEVSLKSFRAPFSKGAIAPLLKRQFRTRARGTRQKRDACISPKMANSAGTAEIQKEHSSGSLRSDLLAHARGFAYKSLLSIGPRANSKLQLLKSRPNHAFLKKGTPKTFNHSLLSHMLGSYAKLAISRSRNSVVESVVPPSMKRARSTVAALFSNVFSIDRSTPWAASVHPR